MEECLIQCVTQVSTMRNCKIGSGTWAASQCQLFCSRNFPVVKIYETLRSWRKLENLANVVKSVSVRTLVFSHENSKSSPSRSSNSSGDFQNDSSAFRSRNFCKLILITVRSFILFPQKELFVSFLGMLITNMFQTIVANKSFSI